MAGTGPERQTPASLHYLCLHLADSILTLSLRFIFYFTWFSVSSSIHKFKLWTKALQAHGNVTQPLLHYCQSVTSSLLLLTLYLSISTHPLHLTAATHPLLHCCHSSSTLLLKLTLNLSNSTNPFPHCCHSPSTSLLPLKIYLTTGTQSLPHYH